MYKIVEINKENLDVYAYRSVFGVGEVHVDSEKLIRLFGKPLKSSSYKSDWEWILNLNDKEWVYIYDYKVGKNYHGEDGLDFEDISEWHIGSTSIDTINFISEILLAPEWEVFEDVRKKLFIELKDNNEN